MKTILFSILALATALLLVRCATQTEPETVVHILNDETEVHTAEPRTDEIMPLLGLAENKWAGAEITFSTVTDVSYNRQTSFVLPKGENRLNASTYTRDRDIKKFRDSIDAFIGQMKTDTVGRQYSSIYVPLAEALNKLAGKSDNRYLVVYSDMLEHDKDLSFYNPKTIQALRSHPEEIAERMRAKLPLKKLDGIIVYIIFEPKDSAGDDLFRLASGFYKTLLEESGAEVIIAANLPTK